MEARPQRGTFVPPISLQMVEDARFMREAIEADITKLATTMFDAKMISTLDKQIEAQRNADSIEAFVELDDRFDRSIADGVGRSHA